MDKDTKIDWNSISFTNKNADMSTDKPSNTGYAQNKSGDSITRNKQQNHAQSQNIYEKSSINEARPKEYVAPPLSLLRDYSPDAIFTDHDRVRNLGAELQQTCDDFGIAARVVDMNATSLAVTFKLKTDPGVSIKSINKLKVDFEVALGSFIEINPDPNEEYVIQISAKNMNRPLIGLKSVLESDVFRAMKSPLAIAAGIDVQGNPLVIDIANAPHMLIAGTTGSGKSVFIDDILLSILYHTSPDDVRFLLIDPKYVELMPYNGIPHLLSPVIKDGDKSLDAFLWLEDEMLSRYDYFSQYGVKHIEAYNEKMSKIQGIKLPRILIIIDEYMDLMLDSPTETNDIVDRIARLGRAAGIHLILATQLPVAKIVTPQIKANIPCRASFTVVDNRESRIILDKTGAEKLLGSGDMIYSTADNKGAVHAQAAYVSDTELWSIVDYIKKNN